MGNVVLAAAAFVAGENPLSSPWLIILLTGIVLLPVIALGLVLVFSISVFAWQGIKDRIQAGEDEANGEE